MLHRIHRIHASLTTPPSQPDPTIPPIPAFTTPPNMPSRRAFAMYDTPLIRNGGFGALQVEALTNRPLSIARRHLAASQLRMRLIEPDELTSSEWIRFLVMEERERERWMMDFVRRRNIRDGSGEGSSRGSTSSNSSSEGNNAPNLEKAELARMEEEREALADAAVAAAAPPSTHAVGVAPAVSVWVRQFDAAPYTPRRPMHARRAVTDGLFDAPPPAYESPVRSRTPPPAYEPQSPPY